MGATLPTLLRAVHPGTIAMTDLRQRLRPKVLTRHLGDLGILHVISCSDEHIVLGIRHYGSIPINDDAPQTHAAERPRGRAVLYLFSIEHAEQRWGGGSPGPLSVCVRASSHTLVGGHHHEETDHRVHAFATKPSGH